MEGQYLLSIEGGGVHSKYGTEGEYLLSIEGGGVPSKYGTEGGYLLSIERRGSTFSVLKVMLASKSALSSIETPLRHSCSQVISGVRLLFHVPRGPPLRLAL